MIIRRKYTGNFTVIGNTPMNDEHLTAEALGVLCYLRSRPDDWKVIPPQLGKRFRCGRDRIQRILRELIESAYIVRSKQTRDPETERWSPIEYMVYDDCHESPVPEKPLTDAPVTGNEAALIRTVPKRPDAQNPSPSDSATVKRPVAPFTEDDVHTVEEILANIGRPMTIGGLVEYARQHGDSLDGKVIDRMARAGAFKCQGKYLLAHEPQDA